MRHELLELGPVRDRTHLWRDVRVPVRRLRWAEYVLAFDGVCSGKLSFTSTGSSPAKSEFFGKGPGDGGDVLLETITSEPRSSPGIKSFLLSAPATKMVLSVPFQTTAYLDDLQLNE